MHSGHYQRFRRTDDESSSYSTTAAAFGTSRRIHDKDNHSASTSSTSSLIRTKRQRQRQQQQQQLVLSPSDRRTRQLALVLIFGISFGIFHMLWLHTQLMDYDNEHNDESIPTTPSSQLLPLRYWKSKKDALLKQEIYHTLECYKIIQSSRRQHGRYSYAGFTITTARHLYCQVAAPDNQSLSSSFHNGRFFSFFSLLSKQTDSSMMIPSEQQDVLLTIYKFAKRIFTQAVVMGSTNKSNNNNNRQNNNKNVLDANDWLRSVLHQAVPVRTSLLGRPVELWAPARDQGLVQALEEIHERYGHNDDGNENNHSNGENNNNLPLEEWMKNWSDTTSDKLFMVQAGSHLGITILAVLQRCPQCRILSLEAAAPNVLLQLLNLARNNVNSDDHHHQEAQPQQQEQSVTVMPVALGDAESKVLHFAWQPYATASCKSWPSADETASASLLPSSFQFTAPATSMDAVLEQYYNNGQDATQELQQEQFTMKFAAGKTTIIDISTNSGNKGVIDLLVMDCQGCEYDVMPHFLQSRENVKAKIRQMVGTIHWGSIPRQAKPSSARARATHRILCQYPDFTQRFKECCEYHNLDYTHNEGDLCHDFQSWATEQSLWAVPEDTPGWKQELPLDALADGGGGNYNYGADFWRKGQEVEDEELTEEEIRLIGGDDVL